MRFLEGAVIAMVSFQSCLGLTYCSWHASTLLGLSLLLAASRHAAGLTRTAFPQGLDLAPYISEAGSLENTGPCTYDLAGVCAHDGKSVNCGHYRAVCRHGLALCSCCRWQSFLGCLVLPCIGACRLTCQTCKAQLLAVIDTITELV